jgi:hypothetical protein
MSRDDQHKLFQQNQADAATARGGVAGGLADYNAKLDAYMKADPYKAGGEFATDESNINAARANADSASVRDTLERHGRTSGENTSGYGANAVAATRQATLDESNAQSQSEVARLDNENKYQQFGIGASTFPVTANENMYASASGNATQNAKAPGFWDWFMQNAQQGAQTGAKIATAGAGAA